MHMNVLAARYTTSKDKSLSPLDPINSLAEEIIKSVALNPMVDEHPEFREQFTRHHLAAAQACRGLYFNHQREVALEERLQSKSIAGELYLSAALNFSEEDDPDFANFCYIAAEAFLMGSRPVSFKSIKTIASIAEDSEKLSSEVFRKMRDSYDPKVLVHKLSKRADIPDDTVVSYRAVRSDAKQGSEGHVNAPPAADGVDEEIDELVKVFRSRVRGTHGVDQTRT